MNHATNQSNRINQMDRSPFITILIPCKVIDKRKRQQKRSDNIATTVTKSQKRRERETQSIEQEWRKITKSKKTKRDRQTEYRAIRMEEKANT